MKVEVLVQPHGATVGDRLIAELGSGRWQRFRCAVAFAKLSGVRYIDLPLRSFVKAGGIAELAIGIDNGGTSFEAASHLAGSVRPSGRVVISHELGPPRISFHPKIYALTSADPTERALVILGSSNLTQGGLFTNHELSTAFELDRSDPSDRKLLADFASQLDAWHNLSSGLAVAVTRSRLLALYDEGRLPSEARIAASRGAVSPTSVPGGGTSGLIAGRRPAKKPVHPSKLGAALAPLPPRLPARVTLPPPPPAPPPKAGGALHDAFYIDAGAGSAKTEIYLSKTALMADPAFFGHPFTGSTTPKAGGSRTPQPELDPRPIVDVRLLDATGAPVPEHTHLDYPLRVWEYAIGKNAKHEVRINIPAPLLHRLPEGCILEMRRHPIRAGIDYRLDFLEPGSAQWEKARARATTPLPNSPRKFGWS
ncbi:MAG TPA: phospholipase D family protein [Solirubrobacterales bacterium]|nr:phospholipase D family protein [Solirubrobacterales bacterium]